MFKESSGNKLFVYALIFLVAVFSTLYAYNKEPYTEGVFWQVSKDGEMLGHIYGTIHMNDEKVTKLDKKVMDIFDNSVGYSIEAFPSSHLWNPYHGFENIKKKMMFEDKTLADVAGEKTANDVFQILTKNGVNEEYATKIKPWAALFSIAAKSKHTGPIVDHKLLDLASIQEKEIYQIESSQEINVYVMEKYEINMLEDKTKDGIHLVFTISMHKAEQVILRKKIINDIGQIWDNLPITNTFDEVFDELSLIHI